MRRILHSDDEDEDGENGVEGVAGDEAPVDWEEDLSLDELAN